MRANPTVIGAFVIGALVLGVGAILLFGSGAMFEDKRRFVMYFEDPVDGLTVGSPVKIQGVTVGEVEDVHLIGDAEKLQFTAPVTIVFYPKRMSGARAGEGHSDDTKGNLAALVKNGLRATLASESLITGQLSVKLAFHPETEAKYWAEDPPHPEIPTVRTGMSKFVDDIQKIPFKRIFEDLDKTILTINDTVLAVKARVESGDVTSAISSVSLAVREFQQLMAEVREKAGPLIHSVQGTSEQVRVTFGDVSKAFGKLEADFDKITKSVDGALVAIEKLGSDVGAEVGPTAAEVRSTLKDIRGAVAAIGGVAKRADLMLRTDSATMAGMNQALSELTGAARALKSLAETLERQPESLLRGK